MICMQYYAPIACTFLNFHGLTPLDLPLVLGLKIFSQLGLGPSAVVTLYGAEAISVVWGESFTLTGGIERRLTADEQEMGIARGSSRLAGQVG